MKLAFVLLCIDLVFFSITAWLVSVGWGWFMPGLGVTITPNFSQVFCLMLLWSLATEAPSMASAYAAEAAERQFWQADVIARQLTARVYHLGFTGLLMWLAHGVVG